MSTHPECPRQPGAACSFCDAEPLEPCPLTEPAPFEGPAVGATKAAGTCEGGDVCEACQ
jgi:hypothetical protein